MGRTRGPHHTLDTPSPQLRGPGFAGAEPMMHRTTGTLKGQEMAHVWQTEVPARPRDTRVDAFRGLRSFERPWRHLEVAAARGDALEMAAACASAARACLTDGDLDEAQWHLQRGRRFLDTPQASPRALALHCELAELGLRLAECFAEDDDHAARRLREDARDAVFDVVRKVRDVPQRDTAAVALRQVGDILEALGDASDAETVRLQALQGLARPATTPSCA